MNTLFSRKPFILLLSILGILCFLFIFLQPSLASLLNKPYRTKILEQFIVSTEQKKKLDGQTFWQTREFYSPGSFTYNHDGFKSQEIQPLLKEINQEMRHIETTIPFLTYRSDKWLSAEFLVTVPNIVDSVPDTTNGKKIVLKTPTSWVYYEDENTLRVIFTKDIEEMQKSNGFFDYPGHDKEYLKDKYWLSVSVISMN